MALFTSFVLFLAFLAVDARPSGGGQQKIGCRNEKNQLVDWFIVYKIPDISSSSKQLEKEGLAHLYMDDSTNGQWRTSTVSMQNEKHAVAYTLQQTYDGNKDDVFHMMYNDEQPGGKTSSSKGHEKGVLTFDESSGFWLIHSVPKFPSATRYSYEHAETIFGQSFLCISFPYKELGEIADQLTFYDPYVYSHTMPKFITRDYSVLASLLNDKSTKTKEKSENFRETKLHSSNGVVFTSFAKDKKFGQDLYEDLIAPTLRQSLYVETWQNGVGSLGSVCKGAYSILNVDQLKLNDRIEFSNSKDHSKWAVSSGKSSDWICIGGINRQTGQYKRGRGSMCMKNKAVWQTFSSTIQSTKPCR